MSKSFIHSAIYQYNVCYVIITRATAMSESYMAPTFMEIMVYWERLILIAQRELNYYYKIILKKKFT